MDVDALSRPFPEDAIKQRKGPSSKTLDYVEIATVLRRLNDCTAGAWSFRILWPRDLSMYMDPEAVDRMTEVGVLGEFTLEGQTHQQFGSSLVTRDRSTGAAVSIWDDLKAAASDAVKKAATHFGIALYLYEDATDETKNAHASGDSSARSSSKRSTDEKPSTGKSTRRSSPARISDRQIQEILSCAAQKGFTRQEVEKRVAQLFDGRKLEELSYEEGMDLIRRIKAQPPAAA